MVDRKVAGAWRPRLWVPVALAWMAALLVLATAATRFAQLGARARQSEAKSQLLHLYTLQTSFYQEQGRYGRLPKGGCEPNELGFQLEDCERARYEYSLASVDGPHFIAVARERTVDGVRRCTRLAPRRWTSGRSTRLVSCAPLMTRELRACSQKAPWIDFRRSARGAGLLAGIALLLLASLFELVSTLFVPVAMPTKQRVTMLAAVSPPWIVVGWPMFLVVLSAPTLRLRPSPRRADSSW